MVQEICRDPLFLSLPSEPAGPEDLACAQDLLDTLAANRDRCVGMAANMIGVRRRIIVFDCEGAAMLMLNPVLLHRDGPYEAEEGCLSLDGTRPVRRWKRIRVQWQNLQFQTRIRTFSGWTAEIIQHEMDHLDGVLI